MFNKFRNTKIIVILIITLIINQVSFAAVVSNTSKDYQKEMNTEWVTEEEWDAWVKEMQYWFDTGADRELLLKVASRSEAHGYFSENFYNKGGVY